MLCCFCPWIEALLQSATKLTALSILANMAMRPVALRPLRALRQLELVLSELGPRMLSQLVAEIPYCCALEMLTLQHVESPPEWSYRNDVALPDMCLDTMPALRHVQLEGCFPAGRFRLPPACTVRLDAVLMEDELCGQLCIKGRKALAASLRLLTLGQSCLEAWPAELRQLRKLHYLELRYEECAPAQPLQLDLIALKDIPHVALRFERAAELRYTGGAWKSIRISGACVDFANVDDFVLGTGSFFITCMAELSAPMIELIIEACRRYQLDWVRWGTNFMEASTDIYMAGICNTQDFVEGRYRSDLVTPEDFWPSSDMRACFSADVWPEYKHRTQEEKPCSSPPKVELVIVDCCDRMWCTT